MDGLSTVEGQGTGSEVELWLSKDEAAALLGVRTRQIERREAAGMIRKRTLPREPGQTTARVVYSRADLLALQAGTPNDYRREVSREVEGAVDRDPGSYRVEPAAMVQAASPWLDAFSKLLERRITTPAPEPKPWLTLDEAADYSGLPAGWLLKQAQLGYVGAIDLGGRPRGGRWRFKRAELARIGG